MAAPVNPRQPIIPSTPPQAVAPRVPAGVGGIPDTLLQRLAPTAEKGIIQRVGELLWSGIVWLYTHICCCFIKKKPPTPQPAPEQQPPPPPVGPPEPVLRVVAPPQQAQQPPIPQPAPQAAVQQPAPLVAEPARQPEPLAAVPPQQPEPQPAPAAQAGEPDRRLLAAFLDRLRHIPTKDDILRLFEERFGEEERNVIYLRVGETAPLSYAQSIAHGTVYTENYSRYLKTQIGKRMVEKDPTLHVLPLLIRNVEALAARPD